MLSGLKRAAYHYHAVKTTAEFRKLNSLKTPLLVDFSAEWCGPCKILWPTLVKLQQGAGGKWALVKVDVDQEQLAELVDEHQVTGVPLLAFYREGKKVAQKVGGASQAALQELIQKHLL